MLYGLRLHSQTTSKCALPIPITFWSEDLCLTCSHLAFTCILSHLGKLTGYRLHFIPVVNGVLVTFKCGHTTWMRMVRSIYLDNLLSLHMCRVLTSSVSKGSTGKRILTMEVSRETAVWGTGHFLLWLIAITYSYFPVKANDVAVSEDREVDILHYECQVSWHANVI